MISLFGYDPNGDYHRVTREIGMRRINLAVPQESLLLTKAVGGVDFAAAAVAGSGSAALALWAKQPIRNASVISD